MIIKKKTRVPHMRSAKTGEGVAKKEKGLQVEMRERAEKTRKGRNMRAVNNTLREIILRERPLTVTNNWPRARSDGIPHLVETFTIPSCTFSSYTEHLKMHPSCN